MSARTVECATVNIPCDNAVLCPGSDFPITNYSTEGPEQRPDFCSVMYPPDWDRGGCLSICCSTTSQNDSDNCAIAMVESCPPPRRCPFPPCPPVDCPFPPCDDPPHVFYSTGTVCICTSVGGQEFFYTVPGATFSGPTQAIADALAESYACVHCADPRTSFRLGSIDTEICAGELYSKAIPVSTEHRPAAWFVYSGTLPNGLTLNFSTGVISGTPTVAGTFTFGIQATNSSGNYGRRSYTMCVVSIEPSTLADGSVGTPYVTSFSAGCASAALSWQVVNGSLPPGLTLDEETGELSGVPSLAGTYSFTLKLQSGAT